MRRKLVVLAALMLSQAHAAVTLHVSAVLHHESAGADGKLPPDRAQQMDVTLDKDYIQVDSGALRTVFDFKQRARYVISPSAKAYTRYSLYDGVGFRVVELENREHVQAALVAAKPDTPPLDAQVESELSLLRKGPIAIDEKTENGMHEFSAGGDKLGRWTDSGAKVSNADAARFAQFMRYAEGGHPQLLDKLAKGAVIPDNLTIFVRDLVSRRVLHLTINDVRTVPSRPYDIKGYKPDVSGSGIDLLLDRMAAMTDKQLAELRAAHPCDTAADFSEDQVLDTMLGQMECSLATGKQLALTEEQKKQAGESASMQLLFMALNPTAKNQYEDSVKTLIALRDKAPRKAYMLKLFEANNHIRLGQAKEARALFIEVLEANPVLAAAYKDMGDLMMMQYDSPRAWRCWDIGRRIAPGLSNFEPINKFEAKLLAEHPEYF
jgi:hypothetical protein